MPKPLLLSPCGSYESLIAALSAGADEVYLGLSGFNARASAENFDSEKLREALKKVSDNEEIADIVIECHALLKQLYVVTADNMNLSAEDFKTKKKS